MEAVTLVKVIIGSFNLLPFKRNSTFLRSLVDPTDSVRKVGREMFTTMGSSLGPTERAPYFNDRNASLND